MLLVLEYSSSAGEPYTQIDILNILRHPANYLYFQKPQKRRSRNIDSFEGQRPEMHPTNVKVKNNLDL